MPGLKSNSPEGQKMPMMIERKINEESDSHDFTENHIRKLMKLYI